VAHDPHTHRVRWATAGHPCPIRLSDLDPLATGSAVPLGVDHRARFRAEDAPLRPPDGLLLYTDGLLDARRDHERFGEQRLFSALADCATCPAQDIAETLRRCVSHFAGNRFADDICIVVLRATAGPD
jgi:serine phosphatase RsbU (regulator of sigma subunit)